MIKKLTPSLLFLSVLACLALPKYQCFSKTSDPYNIAKFCEYDAMISPRLSPDGKWVAFLKKDEAHGELSLFSYNLETRESHGFRSGKDYNVYQFYWKNNDWLIFKVGSGLFAVKKDDPNSRAVFEQYAGSRVVSVLPKDPNCVWVHVIDTWEGNNKKRKDTDLVKYDMSRRSDEKGHVLGESKYKTFGKEIERWSDPQSGQVSGWFIDPAGVPGIALSSRNDDGAYYRILSEKEWVKLDLDPLDWEIEGYKNHSEIYVTGYGTDEYKRLFVFDLNSGELNQVSFDSDLDLNLQGAPEKADLAWISFSEDQPDVIRGVGFSDDLRTQIWLDRKASTICSLSKQQFEGFEPKIVSLSEDCSVAIVAISNPKVPGRYYVVNADSKTIEPLSDRCPQLLNFETAKSYRGIHKTEEGMELSYFLTMHNPTQKLPLIVRVHGGPWARDSWTFNAQNQLLASQGYAVLQVNFRGSSGYGRTISETHAFEFEKMVDDVWNVTEKVAAAPYIDESRIAVMGASFGGYATAYLLAKHSDAIRCGIATAGVFDINKHFVHMKANIRKGASAAKVATRFWSRNVGDPEKQKAYLESISPLNYSDQIRSPILITHGKSDRVTSYKQSKQLQALLEKQGKVVSTYYRDYLGHGYGDPEDQLEYWNRVLDFLSEHMTPLKDA